MSRQPPLLTERIQEWWAEQEELLQNEEKTLSATFATSVSKSWEGSELSTGIPCAAQPCGAATEEGEGTASDSFSCISGETSEWRAAELACTLPRGLEREGPRERSLWGRVLDFGLGLLHKSERWTKIVWQKEKRSDH